MKRVFLQTFGCQMNERDSEAVKGLLLTGAFDFTGRIEDADVVLLNTCSVRQHAEDKILGRAGALARLKRERPHSVIGILGCMAQEHGADFFKKIPSLDLVCGPGNLSELPVLLGRLFGGERRITAIDRLNDPEYSMDGIRHRSHAVKALVNIMSGCDHRCTFCIVPMTRGVERSRPSADIVAEVRDLAERGFGEVMLLGQNVNGYGKKLDEGLDFAGLLERIDRGTAIGRVRFMTSHPKDATDRMFDAMAGLASVCGHLHLPVQSGSSKILRRMKREHTREWYLERVAAYRRRVPAGSLSTDIIVGFPGETDEAFAETRSLLEEVRFDSAYLFTYSKRPGTPAARLEDGAPEETKATRLQELIELQKSVTFEKNAAWIGRRAEVLFEDPLPKGGGFAGRTRSHKRVAALSELPLAGRLCEVEITDVLGETLLGNVILSPEGAKNPVRDPSALRASG